MCEFFSFCSDGRGKFFYFKPTDIKKIRKEGNKEQYDFNSHASVAAFNKLNEDKLNKYEYNPFKEEFKIDHINAYRSDEKSAEKWVKELFKFKTKKQFLTFCKNYFYKIDYKQVSKMLGKIPTKKDVIKMLKRVESIDWFKPQKAPDKKSLKIKINSVVKAFGMDIKVELEINKLDSASAWASARASAWDSAWDSAWASAWDSALCSARASARDSARASAFETVKDLMKKKGYKKNPFAELLKLWEAGLYPCGIIDGKFVIYYVPIRKGRK